jgi:hypothetical protein
MKIRILTVNLLYNTPTSQEEITTQTILRFSSDQLGTTNLGNRQAFLHRRALD